MVRPVATARPRIEIILEVARSEFLKNGFGATSIDALALNAGVSKATIYRHYKNKQEILEAVIHAAVIAAPLMPLMNATTKNLRPKTVLKKFAIGLMSSVSHKDSIAMFRLVISESQRLPHLGQFFFNEITTVAAVPLGVYLTQQVQKGELKIKDTSLAAFQFIGMIKEPLFWPLLMGVDESTIRYSPSVVINSAVNCFVKSYSYHKVPY